MQGTKTESKQKTKAETQLNVEQKRGGGAVGKAEGGSTNQKAGVLCYVVLGYRYG